MKKIIATVKKFSLKLAKQFEDVGQSKEESYFGLGQFVLLLAIAPFIFSLELYSFSEIEKVPSLYEYDSSRFGSLPIYPSLGDAPTPPSPPPTLSANEKKQLNGLCQGMGKIFAKDKCNSLSKRQTGYEKAIKQFAKDNAQYINDQASYGLSIVKLKKAETAYSNFRPELSSKPEQVSGPDAKEFSSRSVTALLGSDTRLSAWQDTGTFVWLLGFLLIIPTIWLAVRKRCWGLLVFGLAVPAINYLLFIFALIPSLNILSGWKITSAIAAQVAFVWFALRGHIKTRSFVLFILLLSASVIWADALAGDGHSGIKAQLPILVFVVAAIIARLVVKAVQENAYLFLGQGLEKNIRKAAHALLLWVPLGLLAIPFLYLSWVAIPRNMIDQMHSNQLLRFDHTHDVLDNALQSVAEKMDDAIFSWHLSTENTKHDIYVEADKLLNEDLRKRVEATFDQVIPGHLEFEEYESDRVIIGEGIDIAVGAAQDSTNKAFEKLRGRMKRQLGNIADNYDEQLKNAVNDKSSDALAIVDKMHQRGHDELLKINRDAQATVWWTINYARAIHILTVFIFLFVCLKSFLYVFARVSFNRNTGAFVTLGDTDKSFTGVKADIKATGLEYVIKPVSEETFYISRRFQCRGKAPNYSIPQASSAIMSRVLNGNYSMNKVTMQQGDDDVQCTATKGVEFFEWSLAEGEVVLFDFRNFVGMSESVKLSTLVSTRASSLLLGGLIHSQATGPGKLILMAKGKAEISDSGMNGGSLPPERIIATHKDTRFYVDSELDIVNVYLSSAYVRPAGGGQAIVDVDSQRGNKTGLGSFIKRFILPV